MLSIDIIKNIPCLDDCICKNICCQFYFNRLNKRVEECIASTVRMIKTNLEIQEKRIYEIEYKLKPEYEGNFNTPDIPDLNQLKELGNNADDSYFLNYYDKVIKIKWINIPSETVFLIIDKETRREQISKFIKVVLDSPSDNFVNFNNIDILIRNLEDYEFKLIGFIK